MTPTAAAQRRAAEMHALIAKSAAVRGVLGVVWVRGRDAVSFLDALVSQSIASTEPGAVKRSFLLTPQGKMRALLWLLRSADEEVGLVTQATTIATVIEDLSRFRFRVEADIEQDLRSTLTLVGADAEQALLAADVPRPGDGWLTTPGGLVARIPFTRVDLPRYVLLGDAASAIGQSAGAASAESYEAIRIAAGEALGGVDFDDSTIAHELGPVDDAVDFTKGCYLGQELIARIDSRGRVTRRLRSVAAEGAVDITGAVLRSADNDVGTVTSSAMNPLQTGTLGLALVRHEVEEAAQLDAIMEGRRIPVTVSERPALGA